MFIKAREAERLALSLLKDWGDGLLRLQKDDGGPVCPVCARSHGRSHEAVYPLLALASRTGEPRYLNAARRLFDWGEGMVRPDGSVANDPGNDWRGVTVFAALSLHDALFFHGSLLEAEERRRWEKRLEGMGEWIFRRLFPGGVKAYLNYYAAASAAMALLGEYFSREDCVLRSRELLGYCLSKVGEDGLLYGEGADGRTPRGNLPVDPGGYNAEETLPCLLRAAEALGDEEALKTVRSLWQEQLRWMLPDGAWDDSVGTRAFKWTYWGSRTADGAEDALRRLGKTDPVFAEAALRRLFLLRACTYGGLLAGGPDYEKHGEAPCVHHTLCHMKSLAAALDGGLYDFERRALPADAPPAVAVYKDLGAYRLSFGPWRADLCLADHPPGRGGPASGGALTLLWHGTAGPLVACGAPDSVTREALNLQTSLHPEDCRSPVPRTELFSGGVRYATHFDLKAQATARETENGVTARVFSRLCAGDGTPLSQNSVCETAYVFGETSLTLTLNVPPALARDARFVLPLIGDKVTVTLLRGSPAQSPRPFFSLNPGFTGTEYTFCFDETGALALRIGPLPL